MCINDFFLGYYCPYFFFPNKLKLLHSDGYVSSVGPSSSVQLGISHGDHGYHEFLGSEDAAQEVAYFAGNGSDLIGEMIGENNGESESMATSDIDENESLAAAAQIKNLEGKLLAANQKIASLQKSLCVAEKYGNFHDKH